MPASNDKSKQATPSDMELIDASLTGNVELVLRALEKGASITHCDATHGTSLHCACACGSVALVELLHQRGADLNIISKQGNTPLLVGAAKEQVVVEYLCRNGAQVNIANYDGTTPLHRAAEAANFDVVQYLVHHEALVNAADGNGATPMVLAIQSKGSSRRKIIQLLADAGARVNVLLVNGMAPMHVAAQQGDDESLGLLLSKGADIDAASYMGMTALHCACMAGWVNTAKFLIDHGADPDIEDAAGRTPAAISTSPIISEMCASSSKKGRSAFHGKADRE
ncbi:putative ankyrin repeat protein L93 [Diplonema papillatum]|nr:putative ankyrin repeat protein L93 [Diplonema papillatum]